MNTLKKTYVFNLSIKCPPISQNALISHDFPGSANKPFLVLKTYSHVKGIKKDKLSLKKDRKFLS